MTTDSRVTKPFAVPTLLCALALSSLAAQDVLAQQDRDAPYANASAHATMEAPVELVNLAARQPDVFIGKTLVLDDGVNAIRVGPVLDLRQHTREQELYLVVDATAYFNTPTRYAVSVRDVDRIKDDTIVMPEAPGMHLRGMEYYPEDYSDLVQPLPPAPPSPDD